MMVPSELSGEGGCLSPLKLKIQVNLERKYKKMQLTFKRRCLESNTGIGRPIGSGSHGDFAFLNRSSNGSSLLEFTDGESGGCEGEAGTGADLEVPSTGE
jgi:hypothetical protein